MFVQVISFFLSVNLFNLSSSFLEKNYTIKEAPRNLIEEAGKRDVVLLCYDERDQLSLVLKWFFDEERYLQQLRAFQVIKGLDLEWSCTPDILFTQEALYEGKTIYLLAQSVALGHPLSELTEEGVIAFGKALAELHLKTVGEEKEIDRSGFFPRRESIAEAYPPFVALIEPLRRLEASYFAEEHVSAFIHGDAHPGNVFYDPETKTLTLIDLGGCRFYPAHDFAEFTFVIHDKSELVQAFTEAYTFPLTEIEKAFAKAHLMLMVAPDFQSEAPEVVGFREWWFQELQALLEPYKESCCFK